MKVSKLQTQIDYLKTHSTTKLTNRRHNQIPKLLRKHTFMNVYEILTIMITYHTFKYQNDSLQNKVNLHHEGLDDVLSLHGLDAQRLLELQNLSQDVS